LWNADSQIVEIHASESFDRHECAIRLRVVLNNSDRIGSYVIIVALCAPVETIGGVAMARPMTREPSGTAEAAATIGQVATLSAIKSR
jgi:hypothetical protein